MNNNLELKTKKSNNDLANYCELENMVRWFLSSKRIAENLNESFGYKLIELSYIGNNSITELFETIGGYSIIKYRTKSYINISNEIINLDKVLENINSLNTIEFSDILPRYIAHRFRMYYKMVYDDNRESKLNDIYINEMLSRLNINNSDKTIEFFESEISNHFVDFFKKHILESYDIRPDSIYKLGELPIRLVNIILSNLPIHNSYYLFEFMNSSEINYEYILDKLGIKLMVVDGKAKFHLIEIEDCHYETFNIYRLSVLFTEHYNELHSIKIEESKTNFIAKNYQTIARVLLDNNTDKVFTLDGLFDERLDALIDLLDKDSIQIHNPNRLKNTHNSNDFVIVYINSKLLNKGCWIIVNKSHIRNVDKELIVNFNQYFINTLETFKTYIDETKTK